VTCLGTLQPSLFTVTTAEWHLTVTCSSHFSYSTIRTWSSLFLFAVLILEWILKSNLYLIIVVTLQSELKVTYRFPLLLLNNWSPKKIAALHFFTVEWELKVTYISALLLLNNLNPKYITALQPCYFRTRAQSSLQLFNVVIVQWDHEPTCSYSLFSLQDFTLKQSTVI